MYRENYDTIVVGSGPGGFTAAIAAARKGLKVLMIERNPFLGGLMSAGLPPLAFVDRSGNRVIGGLGQEFIDRLREVGGATEHYRVPIQNSITYLNLSWVRLMINEMCREEKIDTMIYAELMDVIRNDGAITGIKVFSRGETFVFGTNILIDATGDASCAYMCGARYEKGERLQPATLVFDVENIDIDKFGEYARSHPETIKLPDTFPGITQSAEHFRRSETFCTMCFFDLVEKAKAAGDFPLPRNMIDFTHQKDTDRGYFNVTRAINTDSTDIAQFNEAEDTCERQIIDLMKFLRKYCPGFENCTLGAVTPYLGIRESRRIVGKKTLTDAILKDLPIPDDSIALAGYNVDIHGQDSGIMTMYPIKHAIGVPYGCMIPENTDGLIMSGRTISVDQTVFGMTRVMSTCLAIGEAAGTAAAIAYKKGILPSQVDVKELREELLKQGAILELGK